MLSPYDYELLSRFRYEPQAPQSDLDRLAFNRLQSEGYIFPHQTEYREEPGCSGVYAITWELTPKGRAHLSDADNRRDKMTKEAAKAARQRKSDRAFQFFLVLLGGVITLLVEHFSLIVHWVSSLFG